MSALAWAGQILLAAVFTGSGIAKSTMTKERMLATGQTGVAPFPLPAIRFTAAMELLGAVGLLVPWATGIAPALTPLAAVGLGMIMVAAAASHAYLREPRNVAVNVLLFTVCILVATIRFGDL